MHISYHKDLQVDNSIITLSEEESFHLSKVLRAESGTELMLANGQGIKALARIISPHPKRTEVEILHFEPIQSAPSKSIHLAIAPTKNNDRIEWLFEKCTEIGVDEISLLQCKNSERVKINHERLEKIVLSAFKQSKRGFLPKLNEIKNLSSFLKIHSTGFIAHCYSDSNLCEAKTVLNANWINGPILIGPEGDFSKEEVLEAVHLGYQTLDLGTNRLRTETAGLLAVSSQAIARNTLV